MFHGLANQCNLLDVEIVQIRRLESPFDFGIAAERACAGTWCVDQNSIEFGSKWQGLCAIQHYKRAVEIAHLSQTVQVNIARDSVSSQLDGLRGFVPRRGANVEKCLARVQIEQRHDGLRADVLDASRASDVGLGRL